HLSLLLSRSYQEFTSILKTGLNLSEQWAFRLIFHHHAGDHGERVTMIFLKWPKLGGSEKQDEFVSLPMWVYCKNVLYRRIEEYAESAYDVPVRYTGLRSGEKDRRGVIGSHTVSVVSFCRGLTIGFQVHCFE
ncbi:MAG: hypothetical protein ACK4VW_10305, partial [Anaerolineales bacterium]